MTREDAIQYAKILLSVIDRITEEMGHNPLDTVDLITVETARIELEKES